MVDRLQNSAQNELINIVTIFLALTVGATARGETFLTLQTIEIIVMGLVAFCYGHCRGCAVRKADVLFDWW